MAGVDGGATREHAVLHVASAATRIDIARSLHGFVRSTATSLPALADCGATQWPLVGLDASCGPTLGFPTLCASLSRGRFMIQ